MEDYINLVSKSIGPVGLGLMGMTWRPEPPPTQESYKALSTALTLGVNFWNGGEIYGPPDNHSCHLLYGYFTKHPEDADKVVLSMKGGTVPGTLQPDGSASNLRRSVENCIKTLGGKKLIDIFQCSRIDQSIPIEDIILSLAELVKEEKIGAIGLSEVQASTIERAHAVHPIAAVEVELSLWTTDILENGVAATCGRLGIPIVAYGPLSQGAMTSTGIRKNSDIPDGDMRKSLPKFQDDVLEQNNKIFDAVGDLAAKKGVTRAQIAIAWVRACSNRMIMTADGEEYKTGIIIPLPGATTAERVTENSTLVELTEDDMLKIMEILKKYPVKGERYGKSSMARIES